MEELKVARVNFPNSCLTLPLNTIPDIKGRPIQELMIYVKNIDGYSIEIQFVGDSLDTGRNIKEHSLYSSGDVIKLTERKKSYYMVDITQKVFVEEDPNNNCREYPNQDFRSYQECEDRYIRNLLPGLTPLWLSDNFAEVSTQVFDENDRYFSPLGDFAAPYHIGQHKQEAKFCMILWAKALALTFNSLQLLGFLKQIWLSPPFPVFSQR